MMPVKFIVFQILLLVIACEAQAKKYDFSVAIQLEPIMYAHKKFVNHPYDKVTVARLQDMAAKEAQDYFTKVKTFSPNETANFFILLKLTYGSYHRMDSYEFSYPERYCISLKYESNTRGISECDEDGVEDALEAVFEKLEDKEEALFESIQGSKRKIVWLDALDRGVVYNKLNNPVTIKEDILQRGGFKNNLRALLGRYFQDGSESINFFRSEDLITVIMKSPNNINKYHDFLMEIIKRTRKRHRMWPFYMHQAVRVDAPLDVIKEIGKKKNTQYDQFLDADGNTPLMHAVWTGNLALTEFFLQQKSNPKLKNKMGIGLVHYAAVAIPSMKNFKVLDLVLKQGLDINDISDAGAYPLATAVAVNSATGVPMDGVFLVNGFKQRHSSIDIPRKARDKAFSPLLQSIYYKEHAAGNRLIELGANVEDHPKNSATPLQVAAGNQDLHFVKLLLNAGANPNAIGPDKKTALHYAYPKPESELSTDVRKIIKALLDKGADPAFRDSSGKTAKQIYTDAREIYLEEQRILAYNKRMRELKLERERLAREERERKRLAAQREKEKNGFNWGKAVAMGAGAYIGGISGLDLEAQVKVVSGIIQDSQAGVEGASNTMGAINSTTQRYNRQSAARKRTSASMNAKDHYLVVRGRSDLRGCNMQDAQAKSFCRLANVYYDRYVNAVKDNLKTSDEIYAIHKRTVRDLLDLMANSRNRTTLDLTDTNTPAPSAPDKRASNTSASSAMDIYACDSREHSCAIPE